ncbi:MAG: hypothetical protein R2684_02890 [Pyrinomonadaceae bacterium]
MHPILRNILAVIAAVIAGGAANMATLLILSSFIGPPEGVDPGNMESIKANINLYTPLQLSPAFFAHAIGSFVSGLVVALLATSKKRIFALGLGVWNLLGGIAAVFLIGGPLWFILADLVLAYIPTAYIGGVLADRGKK